MAKTINSISTRKNVMINGNMDLWQRGTSFASPSSGSYTADRFRIGHSNTATRTISRSTLVPNAASSFSLQHLVGTADTSVAAGDSESIQYHVEGFDFLPLAGKTITLSFWVRSSITGIYCVSFRNSAFNRSYVSTYTINAISTWEKKTITLTHDDTGAWLYGNGTGIIVNFVLMAGTTIQAASLDTWLSGNFVGHSSAVNFMGTAGAQFNLSQVMLNEGSEAAPFMLSGEDIQGEIARCQRYYEKSYDLSVVPGTNTSTGMISTPPVSGVTNVNNMTGTQFKVPKRAAPSVTVWTQAGVINNVRYNSADFLVGISNVGEHAFTVFNNSGGAMPSGTIAVTFQYAADAEL